MSHTIDVAHYYDRLTALFQRAGFTKRTGAIHRVVKPPADLHLDGATQDTIHALVIRELSALPACDAVADLGCGVGASMHAVATGLTPSTHVSGITISPVQATYVQSGSVFVASFDALPYADASLAAVWAIESFAHCHNPAHFFAEVARVLRPGGLCIICDDMLAPNHVSPFIAAFQNGWMVPNIVTRDIHQQRANLAGLRLSTHIDLSDGLTIRALPDMLAQWIVDAVLPRVHTHLFLRSMIGSMALQQCYKHRAMRYEFVVFEKSYASK